MYSYELATPAQAGFERSVQIIVARGIRVFMVLRARKWLRFARIGRSRNDGDAMAFLLNRAPSRIAGVLVALLVAAAGARAEEPYSFAATPGKLPKTVVPV